MSNANVATLKKHLEQLFPGKWLTGSDNGRALLTGIREFDAGVASGLARRKVSEWNGLPSSGKSTFLRAIIARWCLNGLNVAYVDTFSRLVASDWAFVREGLCGAMPLSMMRQPVNGEVRRGQFYAVRVSECLAKNRTRKTDEKKKYQEEERSERDIRREIRDESCWIVEQLIRSRLFDVIVFDQGESLSLSDRMYARLSRTLDRSRTALIVMKDVHTSGGTPSSWGCHTRASFGWASSVNLERGLAGVASITPSVRCSIQRDGLTQDMEDRLVSNVQNSLFTYPQIPDRRTSKTRARSGRKAARASG